MLAVVSRLNTNKGDIESVGFRTLCKSVYLTDTARTVMSNTNDNETLVFPIDSITFFWFLISKLQVTPLLDKGVKMTSNVR